MTLAANEVLSPATGLVFISTGATQALPTLPIASIPSTFDKDWEPAVGWVSIGHTSLENGISLSLDGDDPETLGTWQVPNLRVTTPAKIYSMTIQLASFTFDAYRLYYGGGNMVDSAGANTVVEADAKGWKLPGVPTPQAHSLLIIALDGGYQVVQYFQNTAALGSDAIEYDPTALAEMPVTFTVLSGNNVVTPRTVNP